jgi:oligosaccharide repeat unit polymerase
MIIANIALVLLLIKAIDLATSGPFVSYIRNIRWNTSSPLGHGYGYLGYIKPFLTVLAYVNYTFYLLGIENHKQNKLYVTLSIFPGFIASFLSFGRGHVVGFVIGILLITLYFRGLSGINKKYLLIISIFLFLAVNIIGIELRKTDASYNFSMISNTIVDYQEYISSSLVAWSDIMISENDYNWGIYTFRFFLAFLSKAGLYDIKAPLDTIRPFYNDYVTDIQTNLYTYLYPYYMDYGLLGCIIFPFILGCTFSKIEIMANRSFDIFLILFYILLMQRILAMPSGEKFFLSLSLLIQYFVWPFVMCKGLKLKNYRTVK